MNSYETNLGVGLPAWVIKLREQGYGEVAEAIDDDKIKSIRALERLGLPRYRTTVTPIAEFLTEPQAAFAELDLDWYMVVLNPHDKRLERKRKFGLTKAEIPDFIAQTLSPAERQKYSIILQESFIHCYGGNLVCSANGLVTLELIKGELGHNDLVVARKNPQYIMQRNPISGLFKTEITKEFGEIETELPGALWRTMFLVPHKIDTEHAAEFALRGLEFDPGYYEFYLDRRTPSSRLEPFFIDYQGAALFQPLFAGLASNSLAALKDFDKRLGESGRIKNR